MLQRQDNPRPDSPTKRGPDKIRDPKDTIQYRIEAANACITAATRIKTGAHAHDDDEDSQVDTIGDDGDAPVAWPTVPYPQYDRKPSLVPSSARGGGHKRRSSPEFVPGTE